jgi:hypothetical protein
MSMDQFLPDPELEARLRTARPQPDPAWVRTTGERLFPERAPRRLPALRLGTAFAGGLASLVTVLSLAGVGPLAGSSGPVQAQDRCRQVAVTRVQRVPRLVTTAGGAKRVVYTRRPVHRMVKRCG